MPKLLLLDGLRSRTGRSTRCPTDLATPDGHGHQRGLRLHVDARQGARRRAARPHRGRVRRARAARSATSSTPSTRRGRKETPDLFVPQIPLIHEVLDALADPARCEVAGRRGRRRDRDARDPRPRPTASTSSSSPATATRYQLVADPHIKVLYNKRGVSDYALYDEAGIVERTGVTPAQYPEYAALRGDTSDNLPGVPGIGEKTAAKLVTTYGNLEGIFEHLDELPPKQRQNLGEARDRVFKNREMSLLRRDVDVDVEPGELRHGRVGPRAGARAVRPARVPHAAAAPARSGRRDGGRRGRRGRDARRRGRRRPRRDGRGRGCCDALAEAGEPLRDRSRAGRARRARAALRAVAVATRRRSRRLRRRRRCSRDADGARGARRAGRRRRPAARRAPGQGADARARRRRALAAARHRGDGVPARSRRGEVPARGPRAAATCRSRCTSPDAEPRARSISTATSSVERDRPPRRGRAAARRRARARRSRRASSPISTSAFELPARARARADGGGRRPHRPSSSSTSCGRSSATQCRRARAARSTRTRARSSTSTPRRSCARSCSRSSGSSPVKKTKTGPSTDADSLQKMAEEHPIVDDLLRYREVEKLRSTYADALPPLVARRRPHPRDVQPDRHHDRPHLERGAEPPERPRAHRRRPRDAARVHRRRGLRAAHRRLLADRAARARAPRRGPRAHRRVRARRRRAHHHRGRRCSTSPRRRSTTSSAASPRSSTTASRTAWRRTGSASASTSRPTRRARSSTPTSTASRTCRRTWSETVREAKERGYTTTIFGRRRQLPELSSDNFRIRQMGERMAQNAPVQGSAADIFKLAMIDLDRALDDGGFATPHAAHRARRARARGARSASASATEALVREVMEHVDRAAGAARRRHRLRPQLGRRRSSCRATRVPW